MTILHVTASIRDEQSISRDLAARLVQGLAARNGARVIERNLAWNDLPFLTADRFAANLAPADQRNAEQVELAAIADTLIAELEAADTIVFAIPIYNFGAPSVLKAWADLVARAGRTFRYTENGPEGLLKGKKAYVTVASGGTPVGSDFDFLTPWFRFFLGFLGITDVTVVAADGIMGAGGEEKIAEAKAQVERLAA